MAPRRLPGPCAFGLLVQALLIVVGLLLYGQPASAQDLVHVIVDLHDSDYWDDPGSQLNGLIKVRLSRLRSDGIVAEVFNGRDVNVPAGTYRVEALLDGDPLSSLNVDLRQPEVRVALGVSLLRFISDHGRRYDTKGYLSVHLEADGEPWEYGVRILPVWHNNFSIGAVPGEGWTAELGPLDLGDYVLVVLS